MSSSDKKPSSGQTNTLKEKEDPKDDTKKDDEKKEEEIPDLGGVSRLMKEYAQGLGCYKFLGIIAAICNGALMPVFFLFFGDMITVGTEQIDLKEQSVELMLKFFACGIGFFVANAVQYIFMGKYGIKISVNVRKEYFQLLLRQEVGYYDEKNSGAVNTALSNDCLKIQTLGSSLGQVFQHMVTFMAGFVLAFYYSWQLSLVLLAVSPLFVIIGVISAQIEKSATQVDVKDDPNKVGPVEAAGSFSNEVLVSIRSVKAMPSLLKSKLKEYDNKLEAILPAAKKSALGMGISLGGMFFAFLGVMYSLGYWYGGRLVDEGTIEIGDMYLCMFAIPIGAMSLGQLGTANGDIAKARTAANKFFRLKQREPEVRKADTENVLGADEADKISTRLTGNISFKEVSFRYPSAPNTVVLDKVSFEIESGKTLAIVGPSGSGKSTVINLLERYYDPSGGDVLIDAQKIHNYDIEYLRKQIGFVSQLPLLFAESITENIRGGNSNLSDDDIIKAAKFADAHDFIMQLTDKYDTNVGEMGNRLSGGQKQRIAIARAIVSNPSILLLDEATSALDTKSEREVQRAIDNIASSHTQTIVVIAHRLSTIKNADKILVIVDGEVEEEGNHQSLIETNGVYAALVREQQLTDADGDIALNNNDDEQKDNEERTNVTSTTTTTTTATDDVTVKVDTDEKKDDEKKEEVVPDHGGTKRLGKEYGATGDLKCLWWTAMFFSLILGALWPVSYGWFFPQIITILNKEISCVQILNDEGVFEGEYDCETEFEQASLRLAGYWLAIGVYAFIAQVFSVYFFGIYGAKVGNKVKSAWFEATLRQDITYHDALQSSTLNARLTSETESITEGMGWKLGMFVSSIAQILIGFGIGFYRSWRVTLVFVGLTPLLAVAGALQSVMWLKTGDNADPFLDSGIISQEILTNIRTVLAFPYLIVTKTQAFVDKVNIGLPIAIKREMITGFSIGGNLLIAQGIVYGVGMYAGLRFADKGWLTFDDVMGAFFAVFTAGMGVGTAASVATPLKNANTAANKFYVTIERKPEIKPPDDGSAKTPKEALKGVIEFKNISFAYKSNPNHMVLKNVSFKVDSGSSLAIVGPSGSGKSTIVSLIERFYDPNSGDIILDETNRIHNYDLSYLRSQIGLVSQMPMLFDSSITDNIRAGNTEATEEDIINAAKLANAHEFIEKLEGKYETKVGELGGRLSGGQKQRIAIARALLCKPSILLLDEATSALDSKSEREVQNAIDNISNSGNQTIISIAHRLSTIQNADNIIVLLDGEVRESGNHSALMDKNDIYAALVNAQALVDERKQHHFRQRSSLILQNENILEEEN